jgi:hypothetical protein
LDEYPRDKTFSGSKQHRWVASDTFAQCMDVRCRFKVQLGQEPTKLYERCALQRSLGVHA